MPVNLFVTNAGSPPNVVDIVANSTPPRSGAASRFVARADEEAEWFAYFTQAARYPVSPTGTGRLPQTESSNFRKKDDGRLFSD